MSSNIMAGNNQNTISGQDQDDQHDADATAKSHPGPDRRLGLSELSKQLRLLQATNQSQASQIDRLERQLRLMAEMKGISVSDLQNALKVACQGEAHRELQNQVAALKAQLEVATLSQTATIKDSSSFEKETASREIATLQLRVGELEEMEDALRTEIRGLYDSLSRQTSKATQLEMTCTQQSATIDKILSNRQDVQRTKPLLLMNTSQSEIDEAGDRNRSAELQLQVEKGRVEILESQVEAREKESQLRNEQFKSRFQVQDERISDLEQQLTSLYTAFEILQQERSKENERSATLETNLHDSDFQVALHTEKENGTNTSLRLSPQSPSPLPDRSLRKSLSSSPSVASLTPQKINNLASGYLFRLVKFPRKTWKRNYFILYGSNGLYQLSYSDGPQKKAKGTLSYITTGVSTVRQTSQFPKQKFAFVLHINPHDPEAAILHAAASSRQELGNWMPALSVVTTGKAVALEDQLPDSVDEHQVSDHEMALRLQLGLS